MALLFLYQGEIMDNILSALSNYKNLLNYNYNFVIAYSKQTDNVKLTFEKKDFYHLVGFQYLTDIDIPQNEKTAI